MISTCCCRLLLVDVALGGLLGLALLGRHFGEALLLGRPLLVLLGLPGLLVFLGAFEVG
jgi:hypothetical protein